MAFGQEVGRVLSDGRIVGRAEPFAKVFPSSRAVKRAVGLVAWEVLEDIALDARLDDRGRLVAETNVRQIAANLGLSKTTVHKHLAVLRAFGFVLHEEPRDAGSGRYETARYLIDASACVERFTTTPGAEPRRAAAVRPSPRTAREAARAATTDGVPVSGTRSVYQFTGHGDLVQQTEEQKAVVAQTQQPPAPARDDRHDADRAGLVGALTAAGVAPPVAAGLVDEQPAQRIRDALDAVGARRLSNPAGWLVRAISGGWDLAGEAATARAGRARGVVRERERAAAVEQRRQTLQRQASSAAWAAAISAGLDDAQLADAVERLTRPLPGLSRRSVPAVCAALLRWAQAVAATRPGRPLSVALRAALAAHPTPDDVPDVPPDVSPDVAPDVAVDAAAPGPHGTAAKLSGRVAALLDCDRAGCPAEELSL